MTRESSQQANSIQDSKTDGSAVPRAARPAMLGLMQQPLQRFLVDVSDVSTVLRRDILLANVPRRGQNERPEQILAKARKELMPNAPRIVI